MKKIAVLLLFGLMTVTVFSQGINFEHGTLQEALDKAKKEDKLVFVDTYTTWCGPCKWMTKEIFPQEKVGEYFNENYVSIKIDCEKGEGIGIANKYGVAAFPTLLFLDPNGEIAHKIVGGKEADDLIQGGKDALDPNKRITNIAARYANGERDFDFVIGYINTLDASYNKGKSAEVSKELLGTMPIEKFANKDLFVVVANAKVDYNSKEYNYILDNKEAILQKVDSTLYFRTLEWAIQGHLNTLAETTTSLVTLETEIKKCKQDFVSKYQEDLEKGLKYSFFLAQKEYDTWFDLKLAEAEKSKGEQNYLYQIYDIGNEVYINPKFNGSKESLDRAIALGEKMIADTDGLIMGNLLLSKLYLKAGNKEKALKHFNVFFETNEKSGGLNDHPSVTSIKNGIDNL
ncbi:thioredoxin domain-containing protein [Cellulophaga sp. 20_2_10]|uniref:thioredoxin domain-containing protein n=1 Tax=Cellulophaga sp. 20_2_10 TaxID=2942476 RepID=UPI00201A48F7|nr:thioredoxin domain-containing protein [Cellulophaga sp. 20_2_10]MCL5245513.1 thioredoxin domain-containing protein [Cellulophaga sp. 20_2_10]